MAVAFIAACHGLGLGLLLLACNASSSSASWTWMASHQCVLVAGICPSPLLPLPSVLPAVSPAFQLFCSSSVQTASNGMVENGGPSWKCVSQMAVISLLTRTEIS
jgi:hypothetical protein